IIGEAKNSNVVLVSCHACYIGYTIVQKLQGKGIMVEALTAAIRYMQLTQHIHRIKANDMPLNKRRGEKLELICFEKKGYETDYLII
ncbi:GNAT family N-acetyltransferase, partial [Escherichia coli]